MQEIAMTTADFASVKLSGALVDKARQAAGPMRRSVASQIEYWATLGQALERAGISTEDSRVLIAREESPTYVVRALSSAAQTDGLSAELDALHGHIVALAQSGALAARARSAVEENRMRAPRSKVRKAG